MISYILKRLCWVGFIGMVILFVLSFFLPNYYYTHYHDVHIISSKDLVIQTCEHKEHGYNGKVIKWSGIDDNGYKHEFESQVNVDDPEDANEGVCYNDLKNGIAKTHNCTTTLFTILGLVIFGIISFMTYFTEDLEDYYYRDREDIRGLRLTIFNIYMVFCGHDPEILYDLCKEEDNNKRNADVIPKYRDLYRKYRRRLNKVTLKEPISNF